MIDIASGDGTQQSWACVDNNDMGIHAKADVGSRSIWAFFVKTVLTPKLTKSEPTAEALNLHIQEEISRWPVTVKMVSNLMKAPSPIDGLAFPKGKDHNFLARTCWPNR